MKVLVVLAEPPLSEGGAPGRCSLGLLRGLVHHGVDVTALAARQDYALPGLPAEDLPVEVMSVAPDPPGWRTRLRRIRRPLGRLGRGTFAERVRRLAAEADVIHLDEAKTAWCDQGLRVPSLVHLHYLARLDRPWGAPWKREFRLLVEEVLGERAATRRHRFLVASSPVVERELHERAPLASVVFAPLCLDPRHYRPAPLDGPPTAGIIGTAQWAPTAAAVRRLVGRVWPRVRRQVPEARLLVAGRGTSALPGIEHVPGLEMVGEVTSGAEFLQSLSLLLYPISRGSGMKVKVLESIASGLPVVTTPSGAEGIESGAGVIVERDDDDLAAQACELLRDEEARKQQGAEARALFDRRYSPERATEPLLAFYEQMARS